jgi:uncharacterized protein YjbI with pentapeptide repeats
MTTTIEDACFTAGAKIRVDRGTGELAFRHCSFEGCDIFVADEIEQAIFRQCVFRGATFSGQPLSPRIASDCQCGCAETEIAASAAVAPHLRFRR